MAERIKRQVEQMKTFDLKHIVAEQQELLVQVQPMGTIESAMFQDMRVSARRIPDDSISDQDSVGANSHVSRSKSGRGFTDTSEDEINGNQPEGHGSDIVFTERIETLSVASAELQLRDILSDQLQSVEAQKERERQERLMKQEAAMTKFLVTFQHNDDGTPVFEAVETPLNKADKFIPAAYVKLISANEQIIYR